MNRAGHTPARRGEMLDIDTARLVAQALRNDLLSHNDHNTDARLHRRATMLRVYAEDWLPDPNTLQFMQPKGIDNRKTIPFAMVPPTFYALSDAPLDTGAALAYRGASIGYVGGSLSYPLHVWEVKVRGSAPAMRVMADYKFSASHGPMLHVSMSYPRHMPSWKEIKAVRESFFFNDEVVAQVLPPRAEWINDHPFCHHLWSLPIAAWGIAP